MEGPTAITTPANKLASEATNASTKAMSSPTEPTVKQEEGGDEGEAAANGVQQQTENISAAPVKSEPQTDAPGTSAENAESTGGNKEKSNQPPTVITVDTSKAEEGSSSATTTHQPPPTTLEAEGRTPKHANKAPSLEERTEPERNANDSDSHTQGSFFPPRPFEGRMGGGPGGAFQPHQRSNQPPNAPPQGPSPPPNTNSRYYGNYQGGPPYPPQGHYDRHDYPPPRMSYGQQPPHPGMYPPPYQPWGHPPHYHSRPPPYPQHMGQYSHGPQPPPSQSHPPSHGNGPMSGSGDGAFSRAVSSSFDRSVKSRSSDDKAAGGGSHPMEQDPQPSGGRYSAATGMNADGGSLSDDGSWKQLNQIQSVDEDELRKRLAAKGTNTPTPADKPMTSKHANSNSSSLTNSPTEGVGKKPVLPGPPKMTSSLDSLASVSSAQQPLKTNQDDKAMSPPADESASLDLMKCSSGSSALLLPSASQEKPIAGQAQEARAGTETGKRSRDEDEEGEEAEKAKGAAEKHPPKKSRTEGDGEKKSPLSIACSPSTEQQKEDAKEAKKESDDHSLPPKDSYYDKPLTYSYSLESMGVRNEFPPLMTRPQSAASSTGTPMQVVPPGVTRDVPSRPGVTQLPSWEINGQDSFGGHSTSNPLTSNFSFSQDYPMSAPSASGEIAPPPPPTAAQGGQGPRFGDRPLESRNQSFEGGHYHGSFSRAETMSFESTRQGSIAEQRQGYHGQFPPHAPSWGSAGSYPHPSGYPVQAPPQYRMTMQPMIMRSFSQESDARMNVFQPPSEFQAPPTNINRNRQRKETHLMTTPFEPSKSGVFGWTKEEDMRLTEIMKKYKNPRDWEPIAKELDRNRSAKECHERWIRYLKPGVRKGQWTDQEDAIVMEAVTSSKEQPFTRWSDLAQRLPGRVGKQIRDRWVNHLNPNINHLPFSKEDDLLLWEGHQKVGKRWVEIATKFFKGSRSENHIKNRWYSASFKKFIANEFGAHAYNSKGGGLNRSPKKESGKKKGKRGDTDEDPTFSVGV